MHLGGMNSSLISEETGKKGRKEEELKKGKKLEIITLWLLEISIFK